MSKQIEALQTSMHQREEESAEKMAVMRKELKLAAKEKKAIETRLKELTMSRE